LRRLTEGDEKVLLESISNHVQAKGARVESPQEAIPAFSTFVKEEI
jgi:hypothetical protein